MALIPKRQKLAGLTRLSERPLDDCLCYNVTFRGQGRRGLGFQGWFRPMGWFRWHGRVGAWLALLALALQLGLAFGHVHLDAHGHPAEAATAAAAGPEGDHGDADKDYCPSCAILNLLAGAQLASPPVPTGPHWAAAGTTGPTIEAAWRGETRTAFRSRAPPLS